MPQARRNGHHVALVGLSGVGKTRATGKLRQVRGERIKSYSVDEAIWTSRSALRDDFERWASEFNKDISRVAANSLEVTAEYLGMVGDPDRGGLSAQEFRRRQALHAAAERAAVLQIGNITKQPGDWVIDLSGSFCEVINPLDPGDKVLRAATGGIQPLFIEVTPEHVQKLIDKQRLSPKPLYYRPEFLDAHMPGMTEFYNVEHSDDLSPQQVSDFLHPRLVAERMVRYAETVQTLGKRALVLPMGEFQAMTPHQLDTFLARN